MIDPSQLLRPEIIYNDKPLDAFRDYTVDDNDPIKARVRFTYNQMHTNQTVDFVKGIKLLITFLSFQYYNTSCVFITYGAITV